MRVDWKVVNDSRKLQFRRSKSKIPLLTSSNRVETTFNISDYGYDPSKYEFDEVQVDAQTTGDLDNSSETLVTYFNYNQIDQPRNYDYNSLRRVHSYPIEKKVSATSFKLAAHTTRSVGSGYITFTLVKFRVTLQ